MSNRKRNNIINFRVDDNEKQIIEGKIAKSGLSKEKFFREIIINGSVEVFNEDKNLDNLLSELGYIGNNLNQIARHANQFGGVTRDDIKDLKKRIENIWLVAKSNQ